MRGEVMQACVEGVCLVEKACRGLQAPTPEAAMGLRAEG